MNETGKDGKVRNSASPDAQSVEQEAQDDAHHDNAAEDQVGGALCLKDLIVLTPQEPGPLDLAAQVVVVPFVVLHGWFSIAGSARGRPSNACLAIVLWRLRPIGLTVAVVLL